MAWRVGTGASFATGKTVTRSFPSIGAYQAIVRATDTEGAYAEDWVNLGVASCSNQPPTVVITTPASDIERVYGRCLGRLGLAELHHAALSVRVDALTLPSS